MRAQAHNMPPAEYLIPPAEGRFYAGLTAPKARKGSGAQARLYQLHRTRRERPHGDPGTPAHFPRQKTIHRQHMKLQKPFRKKPVVYQKPCHKSVSVVVAYHWCDAYASIAHGGELKGTETYDGALPVPKKSSRVEKVVVGFSFKENLFGVYAEKAGIFRQSKGEGAIGRQVVLG
jgi:hypothetical protein